MVKDYKQYRKIGWNRATAARLTFWDLPVLRNI